MIRIKAQVLRELGDHGADTLERYFAQIEYTAYWCIRMLRQSERIIAVIPEGIEDVVIVRQNSHELHQVKTKEEGRGPWSLAEVLPILCKQYFHRKVFGGECLFVFVSDQMADTRTASRNNTLGSLWRLKYLLEIIHSGQILSTNDRTELEGLETRVLPKIQECLQNNHHEKISIDEARQMLRATLISTNNHALRKPDNYLELETTFDDVIPGALAFNNQELRDIYDRVLMLILRKIITSRSLDERRITWDDVLNCRSVTTNHQNSRPNLDLLPGRTILDKKAILSGFDATELPRFHRQLKMAEWNTRRLEALGLDYDLEMLRVALLDLHGSCRHRVCRERQIISQPGPYILEEIRSHVHNTANRFVSRLSEVDEQFCIGLLWRETNLCNAWWHNPHNNNSNWTFAKWAGLARSGRMRASRRGGGVDRRARCQPSSTIPNWCISNWRSTATCLPTSPNVVTSPSI
jgi:hypothetical protein